VHLKRFFIIAGEPSGDIHGAKLMASLKSIDSSIEFDGIGGEKMHKQGLNSLFPISEMSVVGMWEVLKKLSYFNQVMNTCKTELQRKKYDAFIPVDYPGFNLRLAGYAKSINIKVIYYIAPQLWAWGKNRALKLKNNTDLLLTVFPFEKEFFDRYQIRTEFVGHPLLDQTDFPADLPEQNNREKIISIFPGSRKQELLKHSKLIIDVISILNKELPDYKMIIAKSKSVDDSLFNRIKTSFPELELSTDARTLMKRSAAGIVKTGTTNLEAALCGLPINMFYITSFLSYWIGRNVVNLEHLSLINILSGRTVINEYIQQDAKPKAIANDIIDIVTNEKRYNDIQLAYVQIRKLLGERGASDNAARIIMDYVQ